MKKWPKNERENVSMTELLKPVKEALRKLYDLNRTKIKGVKYKGYEFGPIGRACGLQADQLLDSTNLAYDQEEQGREALDSLLAVAFNLGIEQGRRCTVDDNFNFLRSYLERQIQPDSKCEKEYLRLINQKLFGGQLIFSWKYDPNEKEPKSPPLSEKTAKLLQNMLNRLED